MSEKDTGISNFEIKNFIEKSSNADPKANFASVFASDKINYGINFQRLKSENKALDIRSYF